MVSFDTFKKLTHSFPEVEEGPHHSDGVIAFKVKKKVFATLNTVENRCCLRFTPVDQYAFCSFDATIIYPVPNKWGKHGWTLVNLKKVKIETLTDAVTTAYCTVAPPKLAQMVMDKLEL